MSKIPKILIAPLNWGLGHATRCMPIINRLLEKGIKPLLASDGQSLKILEKEYPQLTCLELPAYNVRYSNGNMTWQIGKQMPKIIGAIRAEKKKIHSIVKEQDIDIILSDNRYGVIHPETYNVFISHQLRIKIPNPILEGMVAKVNHYLIRQYDECWVPDFEDMPRISGDLSAGCHLPNLKFIGSLSRMKRKAVVKKYDIIVVLSGPEPQRSILQELLIQQMWSLDKRILMVLGRSDISVEELGLPSHIEVKSFMTAVDLNTAVLASEYVICRSGYSSLMDLMKLGKTALLIPTPEQTEQEYLAEFLTNQGLFITQAQKDVDVLRGLKDLDKIKTYTFRPDQDFEKYNTVVDELINNSI